MLDPVSFRMSTSLIIGVDNGISGALVALSTVAGLPPVAVLPMPTQDRGSGNGREIDIKAVNRWINDLAVDSAHITMIIERPGKHSPGVKSLCSMWDSFGRLCAYAELKRLRHVLVNPQTWQKTMLPGCAKGQTKPFALTVARRLWPAETWLATPRSKKPDEGLIDAALIAEYARTKQL